MSLPMHKLGKLDRMETASVDELRHEQLQRLRWSVWHAYTNVPHYRKAFDAIGLKPMDINSLEDIAKIPFTGKNDLRDNYPFNMFAVPMKKLSGYTHPAAPPANLPLLATPKVTSKPGPTSLPAPFAPEAAAPGIKFTWPTATACLLVVWEPTTEQKDWAVRLFPCREDKPRSRCS